MSRKSNDTRVRQFAAMALVASIGMAACQVGVDPIDPSSMTIENSRIEALPGADGNRWGTEVAPEGTRWLAPGDNALCVSSLIDDDVQEVCAPWEDSLTRMGVSWSSDGQQVLFTQDHFIMANEPDVALFDIDAGTIEVLTQDNDDDYFSGEESGPVDLAPFFGPDDEIYLWRSLREADGGEPTFQLHRLGSDGFLIPIDGARLAPDTAPLQPAVAAGDDRWLLTTLPSGAPANQLLALAFDGDSVQMEQLETPGLTTAWLVAAGQSRAIVVDQDQAAAQRQELTWLLLDLKTGASTQAPAESDLMPLGANISPDGSYGLIASYDPETGEITLVAWEFAEDGRADPLLVTDALSVDSTSLVTGFGTHQLVLGWGPQAPISMTSEPDEMILLTPGSS
ncbi:MAG: hypothetical protein ACK5KU_11235 [Beutenbergiaceae bacterium]